MSAKSKPSAWSVSLPIEQLEEGLILCPVEPSPANNALCKDWEAPFTWPHIRSLMHVNHKYGGRKAVWFALNDRPQEEVWNTGWHLWYDKAIISREAVPEDLTIKTTVAFEEVTTGYGSDNNVHVNPWIGIVARMQDLRRYYFLCLEYPNALTLYRREDNYWLPIGRQQVALEVWTPYDLELRMKGSRFEALLNGKTIFNANDYAYTSGKAGLRVNCTSILLDFEMHADESAVNSFNIGMNRKETERMEAAATLPKPAVVQEIDLSEYGDKPVVRFGSFVSPERQMLITPSRKDASTLTLRSLEGEILWKSDVPGFGRFEITGQRADGCCDIYGYTKEAFVVLDGKTGKVKKQRMLADFPHPPRKAPGFTPDVMADLRGTGGKNDFVLTEGTDLRHLWALTEDLDDIWDVEMASGGGHGSQVCACDINGDGLDEVCGGATLVSAQGEILWKQQEVVERLRCPNGGHVDSAQMGFFMGPDEIPTVHMQSSSAGSLVVNALTGEMIAAHPQGHVQGGSVGKVVPGVPGMQIMACCRWGNYGLTAIYDGLGRLLSRFQPDYASDNVRAINWSGDEVRHILIGGSSYRTGIYDWQGRCLIDLSQYTGKEIPHTLRNGHAQCIAVPLAQYSPNDSIVIRVLSKMLILAGE